MITTIQEKSCSRSKKKTSTSKIFKSLVDAPCSTRTIWRHLNNEKIKHKKRIHCPRLTMKHKEYRTMGAKERTKKKIKFKRSRWLSEILAQKKFPEENCSRHFGGGSLKIWGAFSSSRKLKQQFVSGQQKAADYVKMLNDLSLAQEGCRLWKRMDFSARQCCFPKCFK